MYLCAQASVLRDVLKSTLAFSLPPRSCIIRLTTVSCFLTDRCTMPSAGAERAVGSHNVIRVQVPAGALQWSKIVYAYCKSETRLWVLPVKSGSPFVLRLADFLIGRCDRRSGFDMVVSGWRLQQAQHLGNRTLIEFRGRYVALKCGTCACVWLYE